MVNDRLDAARDPVHDTTERLLGILSVLQRAPVVSASALANRFGVTHRTIRRDIDRLRRLGYDITAERGPTGGYRLGHGGSAVPPLMLDEDETIALAVCIRAAAGDSVAGIEDAASGALAKLEQLLPTPLRRRVDALASATVRMTTSGDEVDREVLVTVTGACRERQELAIEYRSGTGRESERRLSPHQVVNVGRRWYLVAKDRRHGEWRTFRLDRIVDARLTGHPADVDGAPDATTFVAEAITTAPYRYQVELAVGAPIDVVAARIPPTVAALEPIDEHTTRLMAGAHDLDWFAVEIGLLGLPFEVVEPDELRDRLAEIGQRLLAASASGRASPVSEPQE